MFKMLKKKFLKSIVLFLMLVQFVFFQIFAYNTNISIGRISNGQNQSNNGYFWQKAYCSGANYYVNVVPSTIPPALSGMRMNMTLRYIDTGVDITTGKFSYASFFTTEWTPTNNTPRIVQNTDPNFDDLESGYKYIWMESSTSDPNKVRSLEPFNFASFYFTNIFGVSNTTFKFHYNGNPGYETLVSTTNYAIQGGNGTLPTNYNYLVNVKFIPEPCAPDTNAPNANNRYPSDTITQRASIDNGIRFTIVEADGAPAVNENYAYVVGDPRQNIVEDPLSTDYIATGTTNQWGLNTGSVRIVLTYTGVARNTMDQRGTGIAITKVFSGSDLIFEYLTGPGNIPVRTWNRNYLGANVSVNPTVLNSLPEFRKETAARIIYSGADWANSLPNIVNLSGTSRLGANIYTSPLYVFNGGVNNIPTSFLAKNAGGTNVNTVSTSNTRVGNSAQQIDTAHSQFHFAFTDNWAGIASGSIKVTVSVYPASNTVQDSYQTSTPAWTYVFSGSDLNLFAVAGNADYPDYTGYVDLAGKRTLITGDRVVVGLYVEDFVGNSKAQTGSFDMPDYPPAPPAKTVHVQLENHFPLAGGIVDPGMLDLVAYYSDYPSLSGFTYLGQTLAEITGTNATPPPLSTLTGVLLVNGLLTGFAHVDTGLAVAKTFTFPIIVHNIYNQTGLLTLEVEVTPGCSEAQGCGPKLMIYTGLTLAEAESHYPLTGIWYNGWFLKIKSSDRPVLTGTSNHAVLYCAGSGAITSVDISNLEHPTIQNIPNPIETFSGSTLYISGDYSDGLVGVIYLNNNIYLFRNLTGNIKYLTGKYIGGNPDNGINRTRETTITGTLTIIGGYLTGSTVSLFGSPEIYSGGAMRVYTYVSTDSTGFDIFIENRWNSNDTVDSRYYQTGVLRFNNSWIDLTPPDMTGSNSCQSPHTGTIVLQSLLTGYGINFSDNLTYGTSDDDTFVITAITTGVDFTTFGDNQSNGALIYDIFANSGNYVLSNTITFTGNRSGYVHYQDKAGNTGSIYIETTCIQGAEVSVYAIPGYRENNTYDFTGTVSLYTIDAFGTGTLYSTYTGSFSTTGIGQFVLPRPLYGQSIGIVLHSTMHLPAMGFTGIFTETGTHFFDFTIWTGRDVINLVSGWFDAVDLGSLGIRSLLVPGDVAKSDNIGTGSIINAFDMAVVNAHLTLDEDTKYPEYDFDNKDGIISSFEQAVIIQNLQRQGWDLDLDGFGGLNYVQ